MSLFVCPVCRSPLTADERTYACPNRHSFDRAKEGYVNLLPANQKHSRNPGDDREMALARTRFLSAGHYAPLRRALCELVLSHAGAAPRLLDAGCGEGYYTQGLVETLVAAGKSPRAAGADLSRPAVRHASRRVPGAEFAVASVYHLPLPDGGVDLLVDCFSPLALDEFRRVLRPGGTFLYVVPAADHLWALKQVLYDSPYPNQEEAIPYEGFAYEEIVPVEAALHLSSPREIQDLFRMTPYYWKTPRTGTQRLSALETLDVQASFRVHVFRRV